MTGPTSSIAAMAAGMTADALPEEVRAIAARRLLDTMGCIAAGLGEDVSQALAALQPEGDLPVPGAALTRFAADHAYLCGTAAHGIELDDGYREGSVHPGVAVVPALVAAAAMRPVSGADLLTALVAGYETICAIAQEFHPALRDRGFHPTAAVGPLGAAVAVSRLYGFDAETTERALGLAASESGGLFAFLGGGGDVKRLHGGVAARAGLMAALLAEKGVSAPSGILERPSGYAQAFAGRDPGAPLAFTLPPEGRFRVLDCYIKPHACCRHLQPAFEALADLRDAHGLTIENVAAVEVQTYSIAARHTETGWGDLASAQLSFPYVLALGLAKGRAALSDFEDPARAEGHAEALLPKLTVRATDEMDALYPRQRPARVIVETGSGRVEAFAPEASGSPEIPVTDAALQAKFLDLATRGVGAAAERWMERLLAIESAPDAAPALLGPRPDA